MNIRNFEFKAKVEELEQFETKLIALKPTYHGLDHQIDTYFNVQHGRLKLREGTLENALINYNRENIKGSKLSDIILYQHLPNVALKAILTSQLGVKIVVDKKRKIYFIDHVKFHFDTVEGLGTFIEVEAIDINDAFTDIELKQQCDYYFEYFELENLSLIDLSYSDLIENMSLSDETTNNI